MINFTGAAAAIFSAILWAASAIAFESITKKIPPARLNFYKGSIAAFLLIVSSLLIGERFSEINWREIVFLSVSGIIGIGEKVKKTGHPCQVCDVEKCIYRDRKDLLV